jgi:hypothetical protein
MIVLSAGIAAAGDILWPRDGDQGNLTSIPEPK